MAERHCGMGRQGGGSSGSSSRGRSGGAGSRGHGGGSRNVGKTHGARRGGGGAHGAGGRGGAGFGSGPGTGGIMPTAEGGLPPEFYDHDDDDCCSCLDVNNGVSQMCTRRRYIAKTLRNIAESDLVSEFANLCAISPFSRNFCPSRKICYISTPSVRLDGRGPGRRCSFLRGSPCAAVGLIGPRCCFLLRIPVGLLLRIRISEDLRPRWPRRPRTRGIPPQRVAAAS